MFKLILGMRWANCKFWSKIIHFFFLIGRQMNSSQKYFANCLHRKKLEFDGTHQEITLVQDFFGTTCPVHYWNINLWASKSSGQLEKKIFLYAFILWELNSSFTFTIWDSISNCFELLFSRWNLRGIKQRKNGTCYTIYFEYYLVITHFLIL